MVRKNAFFVNNHTYLNLNCEPVHIAFCGVCNVILNFDTRHFTRRCANLTYALYDTGSAELLKLLYYLTYPLGALFLV